MGAGSKMEKQRGVAHERAPHAKPPFTLSQIKKAIPPHCFDRSLLRSFSCLLTDLAFASLFLYLAIAYFPLLPDPLPFVAWPLYWLLQGCVLTGVWVISHECGHHAFSDYQFIDDLLGLFLHSALLVPYFSWKYSHRRHHSNTGSLDRDEVFVPRPKSQIPWYFTYLNNPVGRIFILLGAYIFGWPLYLTFNVTGRPYDRFACHFHPHAPIFTKREWAQVYISDAGILAVAFALYRIAAAKGALWVLRVYGVPLIVVNGFLVLITYLQHTHPGLPHYESSEWDWLRGALSTMDRDYGVLNTVFHNITDTHVVHHLFSTMPHYHAKEATEAVKPVLGKYYRFDRTPIYKAIWREAKECIYVEADQDPVSDKGVFWFRKKL